MRTSEQDGWGRGWRRMGTRELLNFHLNVVSDSGYYPGQLPAQLIEDLVDWIFFWICVDIFFYFNQPFPILWTTNMQKETAALCSFNRLKAKRQRCFFKWTVLEIWSALTLAESSLTSPSWRATCILLFLHLCRALTDMPWVSANSGLVVDRVEITSQNKWKLIYKEKSRKVN